MITREQALTQPADIHYVGFGECKVDIGPRGRVTEHVAHYRSGGRCQTWKTRPAEFRLPVKFGLRTWAEVTHSNAAEWHVASECPLNAGI